VAGARSPEHEAVDPKAAEAQRPSPGARPRGGSPAPPGT
jgi:hypothetical protein